MRQRVHFSVFPPPKMPRYKWDPQGNHTVEISDLWCQFTFPRKSRVNWECVFGNFLYNTIIILWSFDNKSHSILFCVLNIQKCLLEINVDSQ